MKIYLKTVKVLNLIIGISLSMTAVARPACADPVVFKDGASIAHQITLYRGQLKDPRCVYKNTIGDKTAKAYIAMGAHLNELSISEENHSVEGSATYTHSRIVNQSKCDYYDECNQGLEYCLCERWSYWTETHEVEAYKKEFKCAGK